ncbi:hypothetical protein QVD17_28366 [Tagetes erecta]|uniref:Uncharacterized protein n=1 Tax=Tagetes erecta TaxID=13708 RepID=A0AAD8KAJ6_TARER|nr:hypothetical protein QVD17_28366 [Tagetes erecta]
MCGSLSLRQMIEHLGCEGGKGGMLRWWKVEEEGAIKGGRWAVKVEVERVGPDETVELAEDDGGGGGG